MTEQRLQKQLEFIIEIDKLKRILRQTFVISDKTYKNDAEHSWHLAVMAFLLAEYSNESDLDVTKVMKMVIVHDLVEIDAGDTFCYDYEAAKDKREREIDAADRIFALLPDDQGNELRNLWDEFEKVPTPEARFAAALDSLHPLLLNFHTRGASWKKHGVKRPAILERNKRIVEGSEKLWKFALWLIDESVRRGYLQDE